MFRFMFFQGHRNPLALFIVSILAFTSSAFALDIQTKYGVVRGTETASNISFKGIPFAAPPVGARRWTAPADPMSWTGVRTTDQFGSRCLQPDLSTMQATGSEDCLYMNIYRPKNITTPLPVMVFIHGGANTVGSASEETYGQPLFDGSALANEGAIIVTFNYRLGALGFLAHPALKAVDGLEGNYALLDQVQALTYVHENISAFGGDAANVTLFGESAGAIDVLVLMASPKAKGLFQKAIVESGFLNEQSLTAAEEQGRAFTTATSCGANATAACLRALTASDLMSATQKLATTALGIAGATVDGVVLTEPVLQALKSGHGMNGPLLIGSNADEMRTLLSMIANVPEAITDAQYTQILQSYYGAAASMIQSTYPSSKYATPRIALEEVVADQQIHCPTRAITRASARFQPATYRYVFSHVSQNPLLATYGAGHAMELPYVFGTMNTGVYTAPELQLSSEMRQAWVSFARNGNPNVGKSTAWPFMLNDSYFDLDLSSQASSGFHNAQCDMWDQLLH